VFETFQIDRFPIFLQDCKARAMNLEEKKRPDKEARPMLNVLTPSDQRSTVFNPTSPAFKAALDNRRAHVFGTASSHRAFEVF
jgi:hypothetical protein